jgi:hypothetical protein
MEITGRNSFTILSMTVTAPLLPRLMLFEQCFVENSYSKFHENATDGLVNDTKAQMDGQMWSPHKAVLFTS